MPSDRSQKLRTIFNSGWHQGRKRGALVSPPMDALSSNSRHYNIPRPSLRRWSLWREGPLDPRWKLSNELWCASYFGVPSTCAILGELCQICRNRYRCFCSCLIDINGRLLRTHRELCKPQDTENSRSWVSRERYKWPHRSTWPWPGERLPSFHRNKGFLSCSDFSEDRLWRCLRCCTGGRVWLRVEW